MSTGSASIGIVMPAYNVERFLPATLDGILRQTFRDWHCIVVDDGSTDATLEVAQRYAARDARFQAITQRNGGPSAARNNGFTRLPPGVRHVTFMDADDLWHDDALELLVAELERNPQAVGAHALADMIDEEGRPWAPGNFASFARGRTGFDGRRIAPWDTGKPTTFETLVWVGRVYPPGVLLTRKQVLDDVGPWDTEFVSVADWDMCLRVSRRGEIRFLDKVLVGYRRHNANVSSNVRRNVIETRQLHHKTFFSPENNERQRQIVRDGWKAWQVFKIQEKSAAATAAMRSGRLIQATKFAGHVLIHGYRYLRGYPTPQGV